MVTSRLRSRAWVRVGTVVCGLLPGLFAGCGDEPGSSSAGVDPAEPREVEPTAAVPVAGTQVVFEPGAELSGLSFYDLPYPFDVRLNDRGAPDLSGLPHSGRPGALNLISVAGKRPGFPSAPVGYFRLTGAPSARSPNDVIAADKASDVLLLDVDLRSPASGTLYPTIAAIIPPGDFAPENLLAVGAAPGVVLPPGRRYAFVVRRSFKDASGALLGVPPALADLLNGREPPGPRGRSLREAFRNLIRALEVAGVPLGEVAGAAVFTVGDVVENNERLSSAIVAAQDVSLEGLAIAPGDGASHERFCELSASVSFPQYQAGQQPFDTEGGFVLDKEGLPVPQGTMRVPVVVTLPKQPMPSEGYPLVLYLHGSGGLSSQVVDRGRITAPEGTPTVGEGPAHVLAKHGFATVGVALPLNPERLPGAGLFEYINFNNLGAFPSTFRQGVFEQRLLIEALSSLVIDKAVLNDCYGISLPAGAAGYRFDVRELGLMGQSMGAQYATLLAAVEPAVRALAPSGSGGFWNKILVESSKDVDGARMADLVQILLGVPKPELSPLHPALTLLETAWEPADPGMSAPRVGRRPLVGHPVRDLYQPVGKDDEYFPPTVFDAMALAYGNRQAGEPVWSSMQELLSLGGQEGMVAYPAARIAPSERGEPRTSVTVQYLGDGIADPHTIFSQLDAVKYQYGCFFASRVRTGHAVVPAPASLDMPCPGTE
ncbi:MAG TPA: hypothetical protein VFS43_23220 [Polyangiaceae bacterium]|nr:hypothetical protein [Polyangiaceae bacterium]